MMASLRAQLFFLVLLWHSLFLTLTAVEVVDPCNSSTPINNPYRSTKYKLTRQDVALCDYKLARGWYRFTSNVGGQIPTTKPEPNTCGTVAPIWMRGTLPTKVGQQVDTRACINIRNLGNGCRDTISISVKKCSNNSQDYYVYYLRPPSACAMAYCAGDKEPCPKGFTGIVPNCTDSVFNDFPYRLVPTPNVTYEENKDPRVTMWCQFEFPQWTNVSFHVEWFVNGVSQYNDTMCNDNGEACNERISRLKHDNVSCANNRHPQHGKYCVGNRLHCRLRMRYWKNPGNKWTPWKQSDSFFVGIQVFPTHVLVKECNEKTNETVIWFRPTVPVITKQSREVVIRVYVPRDKDKNVVVDTCSVDMSSTDVQQGKNLTIRGVCNHQNNEKKVIIDIHFKIYGAHTFWEMWHQLPSVRVTVDNTETRMCSSRSDPHNKQFDKTASFPFFEYGDYILYRKKERNIEVHTRMWICGENGTQTCNCGIAVRDGKDVIVITVCKMNQHYVELPNMLRKSIRSEGILRRGTHIYKSNEGTIIRFTIILSSGLLIWVERAHWGINIFIHAPMSNNTDGMCGNFNGDASDDFNKGGDGNPYTNSTEYGLSWRVKPNESYFEVLPPNVQEKEASPSCFCPNEKKDECQETANNFIEIDKGQDISNNMNRKKRDIEGNAYSDDIIDFEERSFFVYENDLARVHRKHRIRRDIAREVISRENATLYCKSIIEDTVAGKICGNLPGTNLKDTMRECITDLQLTGDKSFALSAFSSMKVECETEAFKNLTLFTRDSDGNLQPPAEIVNNLCPSDCSNHGNCTNGTCICEEGYMAADCGVSTNSIPELLGIYDGGLCDIRRRPCKKTDIFGQGFIESENLTCHATEFKVYNSSNWTPNATAHRLPGEVIDLFGVKCNLPDPPTKLFDYDNQGTPAGGLQISISNDGKRKSIRQVRFMSYDSICLTCIKTTGTCALRDDSCIINGHCFSPNQSNPREWCQQCMPGISQVSWIRRKVNHAPNFTTPTMRYALNGENLQLQIQARDPDNRPVTYSLGATDATGYSFTSYGLLRYNVTSDEAKKFTFTATDECSATDNITITIKILQCPCKNEGKCHPHPYHPSGSGQYYCTCPRGFTGSTCENNIDDCHNSSCINGTCMDGINNYTCECFFGFTGFLCDERAFKCSIQSCYPGVQCTEIPGNITCGPCPPGLSGDGKTCLAPTTTSEPTTTREPTTTKRTTAEALSSSTKRPDTETTEPRRTSTNEPDDTTTLTPTPTEAWKEEFKAEIRLEMTWKKHLLDKESQEFKNLARSIREEIEEAYKDNNNYVKVTIHSFREGSVVAEFSLFFKDEEKEPLESLRTKVESGKLGTINVDPKSLKLKKGKDTSGNNKEPVSKLMMILIIVAVVIIAIIIGAAFIFCRRKYQYNVSRKKVEDPDDMELEPVEDYKQEYAVESAEDQPGQAQNTYQSQPNKDQKEFDNAAFEN